MIAAGIDVNARDKFGRTVLFEADFPWEVRALIAAGADINAANLEGHTAIERMYSERTTEALLAAGAKLPADPARLQAMIAKATENNWTRTLSKLRAAAKGQ